MRYGTISHPKFKTLQRILGLPQFSVVGLLESVWMLASQFTDDGDITRFTAQEICDYAGFDGEARALISKMIESKWLDNVDGRLCVHDFFDHAPAFIYERNKKRRQREAKKPSNGPGNSGDINGDISSIPGISAQSSVVESGVVESKEEGIVDPASPLPPRKKFDPKSSELPPTLQVDTFVRAWLDWCDHRCEIKHSLTEMQAKKQLGQFESWGADRSMAAINHTIAQGWQGIREPECNGKSSSKLNEHRPELRPFEGRGSHS